MHKFSWLVFGSPKQLVLVQPIDSAVSCVSATEMRHNKLTQRSV